MKKYEFTGEVKRIKLISKEVVLRRIRAVMAFGVVKAGDIGGWIEKEKNLSHDGSAWVYGNARVCGNAEVYGNARVYGDAEVCGNAEVYSVNHILSIGPVGSRNKYTTFYRNKNEKIEVRCGCFNGIIEEFLEKVAETHGENKHASVYRAAAEIAKLQIEPLSTDKEAE
ncbi:MAG: hypothetical protein V8Q39_00195 [Anaerovoracaceae bacterium]